MNFALDGFPWYVLVSSYRLLFLFSLPPFVSFSSCFAVPFFFSSGKHIPKCSKRWYQSPQVSRFDSRAVHHSSQGRICLKSNGEDKAVRERRWVPPLKIAVLERLENYILLLLLLLLCWSGSVYTLPGSVNFCFCYYKAGGWDRNAFSCQILDLSLCPAFNGYSIFCDRYLLFSG